MPTETDPYRFTESGGTRLLLELELSWRLGRLVYADAELRVEELMRQQYRAERELTQQVLKALFEWQKARLRALDHTLAPEQQAEAWMAMTRAAIELDLLTQGWFSRRVAGEAAIQ